MTMRSAIVVTLASILMGCGSSDGGGPPTYTNKVQPILLGKCAPCHVGDHAGQHDLATNYADAHKLVVSLDLDDCWGDVTTMSNPKTVGECAAILSRTGRMPFGFGCDKVPRPIPAACVTPAELSVLDAWVA